MAFRKRNIAISQIVSNRDSQTDTDSTEKDRLADVTRTVPIAKLPSGVKLSSLSSQPITSTGSASLDSYLGGHGGILLGSSILVEETGPTDFAGTLLKLFAAEGVVQGHHVHVVGVPDQWTRELPGIYARSKETSKSSSTDLLKSNESLRDEKMKIAWRYERLNRHSDTDETSKSSAETSEITNPEGAVFCHTFDLAKRLPIAPSSHINTIPIRPDSVSPFTGIVQDLSSRLASTPQSIIHRLVVPSILSPAYYPPSASSPECFLQFLHSLRALSSLHPERLVTFISLPIFLFPRTTGLVRWAEHLVDGVVELNPFPNSSDAMMITSSAADRRELDVQPQGLVTFRKLPGLTERGVSGIAETGDDLSFTLGRKKFQIKPFSLPPLEQEVTADKRANEAAGSNALGSAKKDDLEF